LRLRQRRQNQSLRFARKTCAGKAPSSFDHWLILPYNQELGNMP